MGEGNVFVKNTWHLSEENDNFNSGEFNTNDIRIYDETPYMSTAVPLSIAASYKLDDERMVNNMVNDIINDVVNKYTKDEVDTQAELVKKEILKQLKNTFGAEYVVGVAFPKCTTTD